MIARITASRPQYRFCTLRLPRLAFWCSASAPCISFVDGVQRIEGITSDNDAVLEKFLRSLFIEGSGPRRAGHRRRISEHDSRWWMGQRLFRVQPMSNPSAPDDWERSVRRSRRQAPTMQTLRQKISALLAAIPSSSLIRLAARRGCHERRANDGACGAALPIGAARPQQDHRALSVPRPCPRERPVRLFADRDRSTAPVDCACRRDRCGA